MSSDELLQRVLAGLARGDCPDNRWPDSKGDYWPLSPFRTDEHSGSFCVGPKGYYDHAGGEGGGLKELAEKLNIAVEEEPKGLTLQAYSEAKRLPVAFLRELGLAEGDYYWRDGERMITALFMPYRDEEGAKTRTRVRLFLGKAKGKDQRFQWAGTGALSLYGLWRLAEMRAQGWVLLVEGESDCHTAWLHGLPALGVPGATTFKAEWAKKLDGLQVYVWREPDAGGTKFAESIGKAVPGARVIVPPEGIKDLSEAHLQGKDVPALVAELKSEAAPAVSQEESAAEAKTLAELAPKVAKALAEKDVDYRSRNFNAAGIVAEWLLAHERLIVDTGQDIQKGGRPYLLADDGALWPLEKGAVNTRRVLHEAGLNGTEQIYNFVVEELVMAAYDQGQRTTLSRWQEDRAGALYLSCGPCYVVKVEGERLAQVSNGADGVWFASDMSYPAWAPTAPVNPLSLAAFRPNLTTPQEVPAYTPDVQQTLAATWLAALVSGVRPLPAVVVVGEKGGGKTRLMGAALHMLLGETGNVSLLSEDKRDFWAQVTTRPLVALDNVDSDLPPWFADQLAATVTGASIDTRQLYTDGERLSRPVTAALALTTRTATFARPDIAERSLPLLTQEFGDQARIADSDLMGEVDTKRDGLMSWVALTAGRLLRERVNAPGALPLRFVDFARLTWAYCKGLGHEARAASLLLALRQAQSLVVGEADELVEAIVTHIGDLTQSKTWKGKGTASELVKALNEAGAELSYLGGGKAIARRLREAKATLALMGIQLREDKAPGDNNRYVAFILTSQTLQTSQSGKKSQQKNQTPISTGEVLEKCEVCEVCATADLPDTYVGPATWHTKDADLDVTVTGYAGTRGKERFFWVQESTGALPASELFISPGEEQTEDERHYLALAEAQE